MIPVTPERRAQLEEYAERHGQDTIAALDDVLATYLEWEREDYRAALEGIHEGYQDLENGRTQPVEEMLEELRLKHGVPR